MLPTPEPDYDVPIRAKVSRKIIEAAAGMQEEMQNSSESISIVEIGKHSHLRQPSAMSHDLVVADNLTRHSHDHEHHGHDLHDHSHNHSGNCDHGDHTGHGHSHDVEANGHGHSHEGHGHSHEGHGHSHGGHAHDMNMHGVFLHVLGDFLGTIGVISSILIVIFCQGEWTHYMDPLISLLITLLIVASTIPLVRGAIYILLQSMPSHLDIEKVREELRGIPGVVAIHELHVWQLSNTKTVASIHVMIHETQAVGYMAVAGLIKTCLHHHGIHSTTIQPEFVKGDNDDQVFDVDKDLHAGVSGDL
jgi:solute carrier family 30 (zinc transporter), member 1